ncbi:hypothetical protein [Streptomyces sp. NBC_00842]|uniref:hypothetical protein n=1 Tax=Streptomyces sp. NBC_00842 TaxID=2975848 RepID=UPI0038689D08|nr:hypothetical protein OH821_22015 [Streptomyces sp. NBC_00842]
MAFGRSKNETSSSEPTGTLPKTMPARLPAGDPRSTGHETTYQASRGGWFKPTQPS